MFLFFPVWSRAERLPLATGALVALSILAFLATWPREKALTHVATDDRLVQAARHLLDALAKPGAALTDEERRLLTTEAGRTPFPSEGLVEVFHAVAARPAALSGEARFRWDEAYPLFAAVGRSLERNPEATTPFHQWGLPASGRRWPGALTHMFLHAGFWHLFFNMIFLWAVGVPVENRVGWGILPLYLAGGGAAAAAQVWWGLPPDALMVGASGAVSAVMGWALLGTPSSKVSLAYVLVLFIAARYGIFEAPLWFFLPLWGSQQLVMGLLTQNSAQVTVGYGAHIGGFVFGCLTGLLSRAVLRPPNPEPVPYI